MGGHQTLAGLRTRHQREERQLVLGALERCEWNLTYAAEQLCVAPTSLRELVERHGLGEYYRERNPGRGRPRSRDVTAQEVK